ncbi:hypothetical protein [Streptomyces sp. DH24]|uniref:hypothetical protein n=1 Tax=Streptomyces sp. DH24 TaxID=3040123 RepID=UPI002440F705|nr:hypothetical protein [Streptomyces sp. DH24]
MAVSALTGCVTVQRPPSPGPPTAPVHPPVPRTDGRAQPRIVQAPAREALERISPSREAAPGVPATRRPAAPVPRRAGQQPERSRQAPRTRSPHAEPRPPRAGLPALPDRVREGVPGDTDVCALGRTYGGWRPDSPEAAICRRTYGN